MMGVAVLGFWVVVMLIFLVALVREMDDYPRYIR